MHTWTSVTLKIVLAVVLSCAAVLLFHVQKNIDAPIRENGRKVNVGEYVSQHISQLSPVKEQLGGTFYVTAIAVEDGTGVVSYEDGHNAYTADFSYTIDQRRNDVRITSFIVRD